MRKIVLCLLCILIFFPTSGFASILEDLLSWPADTVFDLGSIRVAGTRLRTEKSEESVANFPESVTVLSSEQFEESVSLFVPEILSGAEGVTLSDDLGQGVNARVDLRGFGGEAKQALVLFDGLRAVEPFDNSMTWHLYAPEYLKQAEIRRGGASTTYGEGALSGAVLLETKEPTKEWHISTDNSWGSFRQEKHFMDISGTTAGVGIYWGARYLDTDGYRQNSGHESSSTLLKTSGLLGDRLRVENSFYFAQNDTGIPGPLTQREMEEDRRQKDPDGQFGDKFEDRLVQNGLLLVYDAQEIGIEFSDLIGYRSREQDSVQSFGGFFPGTSMNDIGTETYSNVFQATSRARWNDVESETSGGVEWSTDDIHNPFTFDDKTFGPFSSERSIDRRCLGVFVQNKSTLWEKLIVESGARGDRIDWNIYDLKTPQFEKKKTADHFSPKIALEYKIAEALSVFGGVSESFKAPDSNALIFETPNLFAPNPNVDPSAARHREIGVRYAHPQRGSVRAVYFNIETKKEILFNDISNLNENFDTRRQGVETAAEQPLSSQVDLFGSYTYTEARFDNGIFDQKDIPLVPTSRWTAGLRWKPQEAWTLRFQGSGVAGQFVLNDFNNIFPAEDYWTADAFVSYRHKAAEFYLKAQNIFGESYSSFTTSNGVDTVNFNPAPRQTVEAGFRVDI